MHWRIQRQSSQSSKQNMTARKKISNNRYVQHSQAGVGYTSTGGSRRNLVSRKAVRILSECPRPESVSVVFFVTEILGNRQTQSLRKLQIYTGAVSDMWPVSCILTAYICTACDKTQHPVDIIFSCVCLGILTNHLNKDPTFFFLRLPELLWRKQKEVF